MTLTVAPATAQAARPAAAEPVRIVYSRWSGRQWQSGRLRGLALAKGRLRIDKPTGTIDGFEYGEWRSEWVRPGFSVTEIIPSWRASTPGSSRVIVEVRGRRGKTTGSWDRLATWTLEDTAYRRVSGKSQGDDLSRVAYDTWITAGVDRYQVRVRLLRKPGTTSPKLWQVGAVASRVPAKRTATTSKPGAMGGAALGKVLKVPRYSQMVHRGAYPQYDGGGQAWCSPTSLTMVLAYFDALPKKKSYRWVRQDHTDRVVAHLARSVFDYRFNGAGNWAFNTAYAADRTGAAFVTRLRNLREAERFIAHGIPLIASVSYGRGELNGAAVPSTDGHLMVIVGFTKNGDVVVNDPAADNRTGVRRTYRRDQFENAWLTTGTSQGVVYVIHDESSPLPERFSTRNW